MKRTQFEASLGDRKLRLSGWRADVAMVVMTVVFMPVVLFGTLSGEPVLLHEDRFLLVVTYAWMGALVLLLGWGLWLLL